jgi:hypothetical protein
MGNCPIIVERIGIFDADIQIVGNEIGTKLIVSE